MVRIPEKYVNNQVVLSAFTHIINELHHFVHREEKPHQKKTVLPKRTETCNESSIMKFLDPYPVHIDILIEKSGLAPSEVMSRLTDLELSGKIRRHQGDYYSLTEDTID
jgi:DNA processing protein